MLALMLDHYGATALLILASGAAVGHVVGKVMEPRQWRTCPRCGVMWRGRAVKTP